MGLIQLLPALCHKEDDIADIRLNAVSDKGLDALNVLEPELLEADEGKLAVEYDDSGLPIFPPFLFAQETDGKTDEFELILLGC